jgi:hypothetical protein
MGSAEIAGSRAGEPTKRPMKGAQLRVAELQGDVNRAGIGLRWVSTGDWWPMTTELPWLIRLRFAEEDIETRYPRREILTLQDKAPGAGEPGSR